MQWLVTPKNVSANLTPATVAYAVVPRNQTTALRERGVVVCTLACHAESEGSIPFVPAVVNNQHRESDVP